MEKQDQLLRQEEEIRQSSIQVLQARVNELSANDQEARTALLELYKSRLNICRNRFVIQTLSISYCHLSRTLNLVT
jgi:hypothetical protein